MERRGSTRLGLRVRAGDEASPASGSGGERPSAYRQMKDSKVLIGGFEHACRSCLNWPRWHRRPVWRNQVGQQSGRFSVTWVPHHGAGSSTIDIPALPGWATHCSRPSGPRRIIAVAHPSLSAYLATGEANAGTKLIGGQSWLTSERGAWAVAKVLTMTSLTGYRLATPTLQ